LATAGLTAYILILFFGVFLTVFGLPGTVLILINVLIFALLSGFSSIGWVWIVILFLMSFSAELLDFRLGRAAGIGRIGLTTRRIWFALAGSLAGMVILTPHWFALGTLIGIFLGGGVTVFIMEMRLRQKLKPPFRASMDAVLAKMTGVAVKGIVSIAMAAVALFHAYS
jgi:hypothetical protein